MNNESLVYLNKVFTDLQAKSCPLLSGIVANAENFNQHLTFLDNDCDCGCRCNCGNELEGDLTFAVESTEVFVNDFNIEHPDCLDPCDVTVDGVAVDDLDFFNDRFSASTNALMNVVSDCECTERGMSSAGYFLITGIHHWTAKLTIVLRGSVFGCGSCRRFKLVMTSIDRNPIHINGSSTFAAPKICLPCTTNGIAPVINFSFGATATLLNAVITSDSEGSRPCNVTVCGSLIVEPTVNIQVTRATLFRTHANIVDVPCDDIARCQDASDRCLVCEEDDDSHAHHLHGRCCNDGDRDRDCGCGCGCEDDGDNSRDRCESDSGSARHGNSRDICRQFNGRSY